MPGWTDELHTNAETQMSGFAAEFADAITAWKSAAAAGNSDQGQARVDDVLRRWRDFTERLQTGSLLATADGSVMDRLTSRLAEVSELRDTLSNLEARVRTRTEQVTSVNPKLTASPYINLLGLQRVFRDNTRTGILIASIVFGVLAVGVLGFLVFRGVVGSGFAALLAGDTEGAEKSFMSFTSYKT